jgi:hypothetical protein
MAQRDIKHFRGCRHLQVQGQIDSVDQSFDIVIADVAPIFAQMSGYAIGAGASRRKCRAYRVGMPTATGVSNGRNMIDINA